MPADPAQCWHMGAEVVLEGWLHGWLPVKNSMRQIPLISYRQEELCFFLNNWRVYYQDTELTVLSFPFTAKELHHEPGPRIRSPCGAFSPSFFLWEGSLLPFLSVFFYPFWSKACVFYFPRVDLSFLIHAPILFLQTISDPLWNKAS